jgi:hypothetical protein
MMRSDNLSGREVTALLDHLADRATDIVRQVFPEELDRAADAVPGLHPKALSQARNGARTNAVFRVGLYMVGLRASGRDEASADLLLEPLRDFKAMLWRATGPIPALSLAEQEAEGRENGLQLRYAHGEHGVRVDWIRALREERAQTDALIVALEQEEFAERRKRWAAPRSRGWMTG